MRSWVMPVAVAVMVAAAGTACTDDDPAPAPTPRVAPTVSVSEAPGVYSPLVADVVAAVVAVSGQAAQEARPGEVYRGFESEGGCAYASARYEIPTVFGEEVPWDDVRAAAEEVVRARGFELTDQLTIPGGYNGFDMVAADGARFEVRSKLGIASTIDLDAPVRGSC